jgi:hypothetical protein
MVDEYQDGLLGHRQRIEPKQESQPVWPRKPSAYLDETFEYMILCDIPVPLRVWSQISDLSIARGDKDIGVPVREGLKRVLQENAALLLTSKVRLESQLIARAMAD